MLLRVGVAMMVFALALTAVAVAVILASRDEPVEVQAAASEPEPTVEPLVRSRPSVEPWVEKRREPPPEPEPQPEASPAPLAEEDWPMPTEEELAATDEPRRFRLPRGAIMALTIDALGIRNAPVVSSTERWALEDGVSHLPGTSFPWSTTPQTNVFLAAHRLGYRGTGSRLIFYKLNELAEGDEVVLRDRDGERYRYRVTETFVVEPGEDWVTGQVRGRDMVTLQTCTPIPSFEKRLIVRADRI
jgi:sortase A